ncbi:hypothetical protein GQX73_g8413 [Xylaria multiplex]|uniref:LysM domain-containing protein n=1 Tax=Xylaria multiplex TaxID=323545 RepID=A0A7C8MTE3_9PEZI|nr:hypothetical protein GQX73_g8413 [Xylaria multiplex]
MFNTQNLFTVAALAGVSLAQSPTSLDCSQSVSYFIANAPTIPPELSTYLNDPFYNPVQTLTNGDVITLPPDTLANPSAYVNVLCGVAAELPSSLLPGFQSYGKALLGYGSSHIVEYDAFVTDCVTTGPVASATISYLNNLLTGTGLLCQPTATPGASSNGTVSTTPAPTATGSNSTASNTLATSVPTAAAAKPTGVLVGAAAMGGLLGAAIML